MHGVSCPLIFKPGGCMGTKARSKRVCRRVKRRGVSKVSRLGMRGLAGLVECEGCMSRYEKGLGVD